MFFFQETLREAIQQFTNCDPLPTSPLLETHLGLGVDAASYMTSVFAMHYVVAQPPLPAQSLPYATAADTRGAAEGPT